MKTERLRQYISKASFSSEADRFSAMELLQQIENESGGQTRLREGYRRQLTRQRFEEISGVSSAICGHIRNIQMLVLHHDEIATPHGRQDMKSRLDKVIDLAGSLCRKNKRLEFDKDIEQQP